MSFAAGILTAGCIIRERLLGAFMQAYERDGDWPNLDADCRPRMLEAKRGWRRTVQVGVAHGIADRGANDVQSTFARGAITV